MGLFFDQITKHWAVRNLQETSISLWRGFLEFRLRHNTGSAFGLFLLNRVGISLITVTLSIVFLVWMVRTKSASPFLLVGGSLFLAGAWGNLLDRLRWGYVIDFIEPSFWATFNLGDVFIVGGVVLLFRQIFIRYQV